MTTDLWMLVVSGVTGALVGMVTGLRAHLLNCSDKETCRKYRFARWLKV